MTNRPSYKLKQAQYAQIYQASERTVRNWMKAQAPLDDPQAMFADFLPGKRSLGAETKHADPLEAEVRYQQATYNPEQERQVVLAALAERLGRMELQVMEGRNFARAHQARLPETLADRLQAMLEELDQLHTAAGLDEHFDHQQPIRADLAKPIMLYPWPLGTCPADDDAGEDEPQRATD